MTRRIKVRGKRGANRFRVRSYGGRNFGVGRDLLILLILLIDVAKVFFFLW